MQLPAKKTTTTSNAASLLLLLNLLLHAMLRAPLNQALFIRLDVFNRPVLLWIVSAAGKQQPRQQVLLLSAATWSMNDWMMFHETFCSDSFTMSCCR